MNRPQTSSHRPFRFSYRGGICCLFPVLLLLLAGCKSNPGPPSAPTGSVLIQGNTPGQISEIVTHVFIENGFIAAGKKSDKLVFDKPAGKMSNLAYGNWIGDIPVWRRVKVTITPEGAGSYRLRCAAYNVRDRGGSTEEELKMSNFRTGPYQRMLQEVAARLKS